MCQHIFEGCNFFEMQLIEEDLFIDFDEGPFDVFSVFDDIVEEKVLQELAVWVTGVVSEELLSSVHDDDAGLF